LVINCKVMQKHLNQKNEMRYELWKEIKRY
jgi:hypothetical protein